MVGANTNPVEDERLGVTVAVIVNEAALIAPRPKTTELGATAVAEIVLTLAVPVPATVIVATRVTASAIGLSTDDVLATNPEPIVALAVPVTPLTVPIAVVDDPAIIAVATSVAPLIKPEPVVSPARISAVVMKLGDSNDPTERVVAGVIPTILSIELALVVPVPDTTEPPTIEVAVIETPFKVLTAATTVPPRVTELLILAAKTDPALETKLGLIDESTAPVELFTVPEPVTNDPAKIDVVVIVIPFVTPVLETTNPTVVAAAESTGLLVVPVAETKSPVILASDLNDERNVEPVAEINPALTVTELCSIGL